ALQSKVSRLRQALENAEPGGGQRVVFQPPGYLLQLDGEAVDEIRFAALAERAGASEDPRARAALLADALALWRGPPVAGLPPPPLPPSAGPRAGRRPPAPPAASAPPPPP